jgi:hypothetical protein
MFWTSAKQTSENVIRTGGMLGFIIGEEKSRQLVEAIGDKLLKWAIG